MTSKEHEADLLFCHWHPKNETTLRCYECETPICARCTQRTPVGYLCPNCKKGRRQRFEQATSQDFAVTAIVSAILGAAASILPRYSAELNWLMIFLSLIAGWLIGEVVWQMVGRRHSQRLWWITCIGIVVGGMGVLFFSGMVYLPGISIWWSLHTVLVMSTAATRLRSF